MAVVTKSNGSFSVKAYVGDAKTLLAFNLAKADTKGLAGFTIQCQPGDLPSYYLFNQLQFEKPEAHAHDATEPPNSTINAPLHKFRWVHTPGSMHQGLEPFLGKYTYTVTPRYFDESSSLLPMDPKRSVSVSVDVLPFKKGRLEVGFTRGFTQSQAFVNHFGIKAPIRPKSDALLFDTSAMAGANAAGKQFTFADEYRWMGYTAREKVFDILDEVAKSRTLRLDMFAYDLDEPDSIDRLLKLAAQGRLRLILDNAALHHNADGTKDEDEFEALFNKAKKGKSAIVRGHFSRYAHDKVMIVSGSSGPRRVLTGSTNFSVTGMYVNSNHVLIFNDEDVAKTYSQVFEEAWATNAKAGAFQKSPLAAQEFTFATRGTPTAEITFAPHQKDFAASLMTKVTDRILREGKSGKITGSVLFAVMDLGSGDGPVRPALNALHKDQSIFSYGISDSTDGIKLYSPKTKTGVLVTGKPVNTMLPPPFNQVPGVGIGHQIHHKFVVCGFNTPDAVVYCGSSNLATGGEESNGDNLLALRGPDVATVFAIEALALVDHFSFLDRYAKAPNGKRVAPAAKAAAAVAAKWFLSTNDKWTIPYYDLDDLRSVDRRLFG
jgi:hypothetical protein